MTAIVAFTEIGDRARLPELVLGSDTGSVGFVIKFVTCPPSEGTSSRRIDVPPSDSTILESAFSSAGTLSENVIWNDPWAERSNEVFTPL